MLEDSIDRLPSIRQPGRQGPSQLLSAGRGSDPRRGQAFPVIGDEIGSAVQ
jgi:hypothetical protein